MSTTDSSPARLAANRLNALKSTGPRSPAGKRKAAQNALKHGLRAKTLAARSIASTAHNYLADNNFRSFIAAYRRQLRPVTPRQQALFHSIIELTWRSANALHLESRLLGPDPDALARAFSNPSTAYSHNLLLRSERTDTALLASFHRLYRLEKAHPTNEPISPQTALSPNSSPHPDLSPTPASSSPLPKKITEQTNPPAQMAAPRNIASHEQIAALSPSRP